MPAASTDTLIGIVGLTPVVEAYPLGPRLLAGLEERLRNAPGVRIENMSWGPIHIVQQFQDAPESCPSRLVLIGAASVAGKPGRVRAFRWKGGKLPEALVQERVYEAVTGVVDLENMLMIGEHFGIWPDQCWSVEADIPADTFGNMVMSESAGQQQDADMAAALGFSPAAMIEELTNAAVDLILNGDAAQIPAQPKRADDLVPTQGFMRNRAVNGA